MFNLCRLCLKNSSFHKHIYIGQSADSKPTYEVINFVYDLEICEGDGLPEYICRECFCKVEEFLIYKKNAQKARSELVLLKWQMEKTHVKEEEDNCEEIPEDYSSLSQGGDGTQGQQSSGAKPEGDFVNLIVCKSEPLEEEWTDGPGWTKEDEELPIFKEEAQGEPEMVPHPPVAAAPPSVPLEGLGMKLGPPAPPLLGAVESWAPSSSLPGKHMYPCTICFKEFTSEHYLQKHYTTHRKDKTHRCSQCGECFGAVAALRRHRAAHHRRELLCAHCGRSFAAKSLLVVHIRAHTGARPFKCERCGKGFAQNGNLQSHYLVHMRRDRCACTECGRTFLHRKHLSAHMALHSGQRPHRCALCGKAFAQESVLKAHVAKHQGKKRFRCGSCGKAFAKMADKQRHEVVHGK